MGDFLLVGVRFGGDIVLLGGDFLLGVASTSMMMGGEDFFLGGDFLFGGESFCVESDSYGGGSVISPQA